MATAEIICIGTEILLGQILNTNSQYLSQELAALGIDCRWHSVVGDCRKDIEEAFRQALNRVDLIVTTGGLGPTYDDLTIESWGKFFGREMVFDQPTMDLIESLFAKRGMSMPESNRRQAYRPDGSDILPNPVGTAPGIIWKLDESLLRVRQINDPEKARYVLTFPGVPSEMKAMWAQTGRPYLVKTFGDGVVWSCEVKHYGIGESALAQMHSELFELKNPIVAPYAGTGECRLCVTARAENEDAARKLAEPVIEKIKRKSGTLFYGYDGDTLESVVGDLLVKRGLTVALAESCTGGLVSKRLTDISGSSRYVKLNLVTYSNEAKAKMLGVHEFILNTKGAVSLECAHAMATGAARVASADIGIGVTGIAGPDGGTAEKPVGLVYVALVAGHYQTDKTLNFSKDMSRAEIRHRTANEALNMLRLYLLDRQ